MGLSASFLHVEALARAVQGFCASFHDARVIRLFELLMLGKQGPYGGWWMHEFQALAVLHLLVVSGSQVQILSGQLTNSSLMMTRHLPLRLRLFVARVIAASGVVGYCAAVGWDAPITRAGLTAFSRFLVPRLRWEIASAIALFAQVTLFPGHLSKPGFYLSWVSSLMIVQCSRHGLSKARAQAVTTLACVLLAPILISRVPVPTIRFLTLALVCNFAIGYLFESYLMPLSGRIITLSWWSTWLPAGEKVLSMTQIVLYPILTGLGSLILVVIRAFRYIQ